MTGGFPALSTTRNAADPDALAPLLVDLGDMIRSARERVATAANAELTMLYWRLGERLRREILREQRADYGKQVVDMVSRELWAQFGKGFERTNLFRMLRFVEIFGDERIVATLSPQLSWSHFVEILVVKDGSQVLCGNVPAGTLERACPAGQDQRNALRAHGTFQEARGVDPPGALCPH
jgi:hypothetical protein